jgi:hypothetical protein
MTTPTVRIDYLALALAGKLTLRAPSIIAPVVAAPVTLPVIIAPVVTPTDDDAPTVYPTRTRDLIGSCITPTLGRFDWFKGHPTVTTPTIIEGDTRSRCTSAVDDMTDPTDDIESFDPFAGSFDMGDDRVDFTDDDLASLSVSVDTL